MAEGFAAGEQRWRARQGSLRQVVRQELVTRQLVGHLTGPARVLDVGCGQGTQVVALARRGHEVTGLDLSPSLLGDLERALAAEPDAVRGRVRTVEGDLAGLDGLFAAGAFDAVLCHGVLMYLDDPAPLLRSLALVVRDGGVVSLLVRNGDALALRAGLAGDWPAARAAFDGPGYVNRIGVRARADRLADLTAALAAEGLAPDAWYGVRVFTDGAADDAPLPPPDELGRLLECEDLAGRTDPYRAVAALTHVVARRVSSAS